MGGHYWSAELSHVSSASSSAFISGFVQMETNAGRTGFQIEIEATPGTEKTMRGWLVRSGVCGDDDGTPLAPPALFVKFTAEDSPIFAETPLTVAPDGEYSAELHDELGNLIGCGNLWLNGEIGADQ